MSNVASLFPMPQMIVCPACGTGNTHLSSVRVDQGGHIVTVDRHGPHASIGPKQGRGSRVEVALFCEQGHTFVRELAFHKGRVYQEQTIGPDYDDETGPPTEMWRD